MWRKSPEKLVALLLITLLLSSLQVHARYSQSLEDDDETLVEDFIYEKEVDVDEDLITDNSPVYWKSCTFDVLPG